MKNTYLIAFAYFVKENEDSETKLKKASYNLTPVNECMCHPNCYMFVYNLFSSELTNDVVRGCRGTVLEINEKDVKVISAPYTKFFNYSESDKLIGIEEPSGIDDWEET